MRTIFKTTVLVSTLAALCACATAPTPAEVCSVEWIKPRAERAMADFKKDTGKVMKNLRKAGNKMKDGKDISPLQMLSITNSITKLSRSFEDGRGIKDLKTLARTCDDPELIKETMTDFMRDQGIPEKFIGFLNNFESYRNLIETQMQSVDPEV